MYSNVLLANFKPDLFYLYLAIALHWFPFNRNSWLGCLELVVFPRSSGFLRGYLVSIPQNCCFPFNRYSYTYTDTYTYAYTPT